MTNRYDNHDDDSFVHVPLSSDEKQSAMNVLRTGNPFFKKWAFIFFGKQNKGKLFRNSFFGGTLCDGANSCPMIPANEVAAMRAVRSVEERLIFGHVKLVRKLSNKVYERLSHYTYLDRQDFMLEGVIALRDAIYNYQDKDGKPAPLFVTYAWKIIKRKIPIAVAKTHDLSGIPMSTSIILAKYLQIRAAVRPTASFNTIVESGNFTPDEVMKLQALLSTFSRSEGSDHDDGKSGYVETVAVDPDRGSNVDRIAVQEAFDAIELSDLERELLNAKLSGGRWGYQTEIASRYTNYRGKPLTRAGARVVLKRAMEKLRESLENRGLGLEEDEVEEVVQPKLIAVPLTNPVNTRTRIQQTNNASWMIRSALGVAAPVPVVAPVEVDPIPVPSVVLTMPANPTAEDDIENALDIPADVLLAYVKRLVAGESRRKLVAEMKTLGYTISFTTLWRHGKEYREKQVAKEKDAA